MILISADWTFSSLFENTSRGRRGAGSKMLYSCCPILSVSIFLIAQHSKISNLLPRH